VKPLCFVGFVFLCAGSTSCGPRPAADVGPAARVRVQAHGLGPGWHPGEFGQVATCSAVMIGDPPERPVRLRVIDLDQITAMRVSDRYDGLPGPDGAPRSWRLGADTTGEGWRGVSLDALRKKYAGCLPGR
jgi:hypothetical protein